MIRFTPRTPCPVCNGHGGLPRGEGRRDAGFMSDDGQWAHCERAEHAGGLALDERTQPATYAHRIAGSCRCGEEHAPAPAAQNGHARQPAPRIVATYNYTGADGAVAYQAVRHDPKDFRRRRPDGHGGWINNLDGVQLVPYHLPELLQHIDRGVIWVEGEKDADRLAAIDVLATTTLGGAKSYRPECAEHFRNRRLVVVIPDNDDDGRAYADAVATSLVAVGAGVRVLELPGLAEKGDVSEWLDAGHTPDELLALIKAAPAWDPPPPTSAPDEPASACSLAEVEQVFTRWLAGEDMVPLRAVLGAYAANMLDGDPVWLMLVGGSGRGKTEMADSLRRRPDVRSVSSISHESALLSATPRKEAAKDASGGLLRQIGASGVLVIKDFTTILSMHRDARAGVLAALREVYDGHWSRSVGAEGGRTLTWEGHLGVIAGCTSAIDRAHAVTAMMGERFLIVRVSDGDAAALARKSLDQVGHEATMRAELAGAVSGLFAHGLPAVPHPIDGQVTDRLVDLVKLVTKARSPVERDYQGEIDLVLDSEGPTRITKELAQLYAALGAIGLEPAPAWAVVLRAGLDSIPKLRGAVLKHLLAVAGSPSTSEVATAVSHPTRTTVRALQDLEAHGVVNRVIGSPGTPDHWHVARWAALAHRRAQGSPEMSEEGHDDGSSIPLSIPLYVDDDITGKVPDSSEGPSNGTAAALAVLTAPPLTAAPGIHGLPEGWLAADDARRAATMAAATRDLTTQGRHRRPTVRERRGET